MGYWFLSVLVIEEWMCVEMFMCSTCLQLIAVFSAVLMQNY
jgi:hypothetical protein